MGNATGEANAGTTTPKVAPHPIVRQSRYILFIGVALILGGAGLLACTDLATPSFALSIGLGGAFLVVVARYQSRNGLLVAVHNATFPLVARGAFADALALSARIPDSHLARGAGARMVHLQRGMPHFFLGNRAEAEAALTRAIEVPGGWLDGVSMPAALALALGSRAFVRAAARNDAGASDDVRRLRAQSDVSPEAEARGALAEALVASRSESTKGDLVARLRALDPYLAYLMPYERALARGLRKASRRDARSIYREQAVDLEKEQRAGVAAWLRDISPEAAAGIESEHAVASAPETTTPPVTAEAMAAARARWTNMGTKLRGCLPLILVWSLLIVMFLVIWQVLAPDVSPRTRTRAPEPALTDDGGGLASLPFTLLVPLIAAGLLTLQFRRLRNANVELLRARRLAARGQMADAERILHRLRKSSISSASANYQLAEVAERRGAFDEAIVSTTTALSHVMRARARKINAHDVVGPGLLGEQAFCRAAAGHPDEAAADLAVLETDYPSYAWIAGERFRTRLAILLARGDHEGARTFATTRTLTMNVPIRVELLCDVLLAVANPALSQEERTALRHELEADATYAPWIDALVPGLSASFFALCAKPA